MKTKKVSRCQYLEGLGAGIARREILGLLAGFGALAALPLASSSAPQDAVRVAAASNLTAIAPELGAAFQKATGISVVFSFASTAQLARQIEQGAPFDVFAAADATHVDELLAKGLIVPGTRQIYATGVLAVWFPGSSAPRRLEDLAGQGIRSIAVARPELAPYGAAAIETLRALGLYEKLQSRLVYAGSVAMAKQYGATGNADAVFLPASLVLRESGTVVRVDARLHKPLVQTVGVVRSSKPASAPQSQAATRFREFLVKGAGHEILLANGYR